MKYLCLAYEEESKLNALSKSEWDALRAETLTYVEELRSSGRLISTEPLQSVSTAATVRVRGGKTIDHRRPVCRDEGNAGRVLSDQCQ